MTEDATEAATPRRLQKAREEGDAPVSRELVLFAALAAGLLGLMALSPLAPGAVPRWLAADLTANGNAAEALRRSMLAIAAAALPVAAASALGAALATLLQTGFLIRPAALVPDPARLNPGRGARRLFGVEAVAQAARALAKLAVLGFLLWLTVKRLGPALGQAAWTTPAALAARLEREGFRLAIVLLGFQAAIALADLAWVRFRHARRLRMTRQQVRDEHRDSEGNPQMRQRLRQLARTRARRRMMAAVPKAAVVITNPTHYAVALAYERGSRAAPRVVAKGMDEVALRIRDTARAARVPVVGNPPLARALYRVELDTEIPAEHFRAVAEIVAYVWRMRIGPVRRGRA